jgi:hypothetical protein
MVEPSIDTEPAAPGDRSWSLAGGDTPGDGRSEFIDGLLWMQRLHHPPVGSHEIKQRSVIAHGRGR